MELRTVTWGFWGLWKAAYWVCVGWWFVALSDGSCNTQLSALLLGAFEAFWRQSIERVKADATYYHWEYVASDGFARVQSFPWVDGGQQGDFPGRWSLHHLSCLTKTWHLESVRTLTTEEGWSMTRLLEIVGKGKERAKERLFRGNW